MTTSAPRRDLGERALVAEVADDEIADRGGRRVGRRVEEAARDAERDRGQPEHATELPTTQHGDGRRGAPSPLSSGSRS